MSRTNRPQLGDVYEVDTPSGVGYLQYTHEHKLMGSLVRVLPGVFSVPPTDLSELVSGPTRFVVFYPIGATIRDRARVRFVDHFDVPSHARPFPLMKWEKASQEDGKVGWTLWDGNKSQGTLPAQLSPDQALLPQVAIFNHNYLVERLATDWTWEHETAAVEASATEDSGSADSVDVAGAKKVRHLLYFRSESSAHKGATTITDRLRLPASVEARGDTWLVLVTGAPETVEDADAIARIAQQAGGEYDGWEAELSQMRKRG